MNKILLTITTMPDMESAKNLALLLVQNKYCACVNIVPKIISIYSWNNKIEQTEEFLLQIKSKIDDKKLLLEKIKQNHSYAVPEILQFEAEANYDYYDWLHN